MARMFRVLGFWTLSYRSDGFCRANDRDGIVVLYPNRCFCLARLSELLRENVYVDVLGLYVYLVCWIYLLDRIRNGQPVLNNQTS